MSSKTFWNRVNRASPPLPPRIEDDPFATSAQRHAKRVHRLKINVIAWAFGTILLTTIWVVDQWRDNGAFKHIGNQDNPGDWNPTLWAIGVGVWTLMLGFMALQVHFERPTTEAEVDDAVAHLKPYRTARGTPTDAELSRFARVRLERSRRLQFHVAAWVLGMIVITPLWALIEWQDNGDFQRWSSNGQPGSWEPWILPAGGIWAGVIALLALAAYFARPRR